MDKVSLYVAETIVNKEAEAGIVIKEEISQEELDWLNSAFQICSAYHSITQIKEIVIENGESYKNFMKPYNLQALKKSNISPERLILLANKAVLNYVSSIKTFIDMETRLLRKRSTENDVLKFKAFCKILYDENVEYRFWTNFRNYIVHCEFPYSIYRDSLKNGCSIVCTKDRLLLFDNWKHSKTDIQKMGEEIELHTLVDNMSAMIYVLYIDFFSHFIEEIVQGVSIYGDFCRKHGVKTPVIFKAKKEDLKDNPQIQPLPITELKCAFDILKSNPKIKIDII